MGLNLITNKAIPKELPTDPSAAEKLIMEIADAFIDAYRSAGNDIKVITDKERKFLESEKVRICVYENTWGRNNEEGRERWRNYIFLIITGYIVSTVRDMNAAVTTSFEDAVHDAMSAVSESLEKYDPYRKSVPGTYFGYIIKQGIRGGKERASDGTTAYYTRNARVLLDEYNEWRMEFGLEPLNSLSDNRFSLTKALQITSLSLPVAKHAYECAKMQNVVSLDAAQENSHYEPVAGEDPMGKACENYQSSLVLKALRNLSDFQRDVLCYVYGYGHDDKHLAREQRYKHFCTPECEQKYGFHITKEVVDDAFYSASDAFLSNPAFRGYRNKVDSFSPIEEPAAMESLELVTGYF